jgi:hypothetical protein
MNQNRAAIAGVRCFDGVVISDLVDSRPAEHAAFWSVNMPPVQVFNRSLRPVAHPLRTLTPTAGRVLTRRSDGQNCHSEIRACFLAGEKGDH